MQTPFDFDEGRFIMIDGSDDDRITLTTVQDLAQVVARAVEYEGKWPVVGGISGVELSMKQIIELGEKIRGKCDLIESTFAFAKTRIEKASRSRSREYPLTS